MTSIKKALDKLFADAKKPEKGQHPDDRAMWVAGVKEAEGLDVAVAEDFGLELARMITVYPDGTAHEMLDVLREHFWMRDWHRARQKRAPRTPRATSVGREDKDKR